MSARFNLPLPKGSRLRLVSTETSFDLSINVSHDQAKKLIKFLDCAVKEFKTAAAEIRKGSRDKSD